MARRGAGPRGLVVEAVGHQGVLLGVDGGRAPAAPRDDGAPLETRVRYERPTAGLGPFPGSGYRLWGCFPSLETESRSVRDSGGLFVFLLSFHTWFSFELV